MVSSLFPSFFLGGFECSTHRRPTDGGRVDVIASTRHDAFAHQDYARLRSCGILGARDGLRWHLVENAPYRYDWNSVLPLIRAARESGVKVVWDVCHYGWPDDLDPMGPEFVTRFTALCRAFVRVLHDEGEPAPYLSPMNEISFLSWIGGTVGVFAPHLHNRGRAWKRQLVRATVQGCEAILQASPAARLFHADPMCNVVARENAAPDEIRQAEINHLAQYEAWDMLAGRRDEDLGGRPALLDIVGVNYYRTNQWTWPNNVDGNTHFGPEHPRYRPVCELLSAVYERYRRPLLIAETGIEGEHRSLWLRYMARETRKAINRGVPIEGLCFYPILDYPGWDRGHRRHTGLWGFADDDGHRPVHEPLLHAFTGQNRLLK